MAKPKQETQDNTPIPEVDEFIDAIRSVVGTDGQPAYTEEQIQGLLEQYGYLLFDLNAVYEAVYGHKPTAESIANDAGNGLVDYLLGTVSLDALQIENLPAAQLLEVWKAVETPGAEGEYDLWLKRLQRTDESPKVIQVLQTPERKKQILDQWVLRSDMPNVPESWGSAIGYLTGFVEPRAQSMVSLALGIRPELMQAWDDWRTDLLLTGAATLQPSETEGGGMQAVQTPEQLLQWANSPEAFDEFERLYMATLKPGETRSVAFDDFLVSITPNLDSIYQSYLEDNGVKPLSAKERFDKDLTKWYYQAIDEGVPVNIANWVADAGKEVVKRLWNKMGDGVEFGEWMNSGGGQQVAQLYETTMTPPDKLIGSRVNAMTANMVGPNSSSAYRTYLQNVQNDLIAQYEAAVTEAEEAGELPPNVNAWFRANQPDIQGEVLWSYRQQQAKQAGQPQEREPDELDIQQVGATPPMPTLGAIEAQDKRIAGTPGALTQAELEAAQMMVAAETGEKPDINSDIVRQYAAGNQTAPFLGGPAGLGIPAFQASRISGGMGDDLRILGLDKPTEDYFKALSESGTESPDFLQDLSGQYETVLGNVYKRGREYVGGVIGAAGTQGIRGEAWQGVSSVPEGGKSMWQTWLDEEVGKVRETARQRRLKTAANAPQGTGPRYLTRAY